MVKRRIIWSRRAKIDLFEISVFYFERNGTKTYSKKLNLAIRKSIQLLALFPEMGTLADVKDTRVLYEGDYSILYEILSDAIKIMVIWDGRQNPENRPV